MSKITRIIGIAGVLGILLAWGNPALALAVTGSPTTCSNVTGIGTVAWGTIANGITANAKVSDDNYATVSLADNATSNYLQCTGYEFVIPAGATINGITVNIERKASDTIIRDAAVRLVKAGAIQATDKSTTTDYATTDQIVQYGANNNLWGTTWTYSDIMDANFGVAMAAKKNGTTGGARTVRVDAISVTVTYTIVPPVVSAIALGNTSPVASGSSVAWNVTFSKPVSGVDASDFKLVSTGTVTGASITSVDVSTTDPNTWIVTANVGSGGYDGGTLGLNLVDDDSIVDAQGVKLGGTGTANGNFTGAVYAIEQACTPPTGAGIPTGLICKCDNFNRTTRDPSTIYNSNWLVSSSGTTAFVPDIINPGYLRLTSNSQNNSTAATVPGAFPAMGNYISVEFRLYAYNGNSADGIAVTLSDYTVPAVPGAFGGSLGYAQKTGINGFAGGWMGVGLDEFGNYQNPSEGRVGKVGGSAVAQSIAVRGSGTGTTGYPWLYGTAALGTKIDTNTSTTAAPGHRYQVIVDARAYSTAVPAAAVKVNRDTGTGYSTLINLANIYTTASGLGYTQAVVPDNWQISFTGSTGTNYNIHEIGSVRICASTIIPPTGGVASGFNAIDDSYSSAVQNFQNGHIFTKLAGTPFQLKVAALDANSQILTGYALGATRKVTIKLVDNSDGACVLDSTQTNYCSTTCKGKSAVSGGSQILSFVSSDKGVKLSSAFTLTSAYSNLAAIMTDDATPQASACSTDTFSVRPTSLTLSSISASNTGTTGTPVFKAGTTPFSMTATAAVGGYSGTPKVDSSKITAVSPALPGAISGVFPPAMAGVSSSTSTGVDFKYSDVGVFSLAANAVYDDSWTLIDNVNTRNDCVAGSYSNTIDANGKYGCLFGSTTTPTLGRFIPDHFALIDGSVLTPACGTTSGFTYMDQPFGQLKFQLEAQNGSNGKTQNYTGVLATGAVALVAENNDAGIDLGARVTYPATSWVAGVFSVDTTTATFSRTSVPDGAHDSLQPGVNVNDVTDGVKIAGANMRATTTGVCTTNVNSATDCDSRRINDTSGAVAQPTKVRFGRLRLMNAHGSEKLNLPIPMRAQYWNGTVFATNTLDSCTTIANANVTLPIYQGGITASNMPLANVLAGTAGTSKFVSGVGSLTLKKPVPVPTAKGSVDVCVDLGADVPLSPARCVATTSLSLPWLKGKWTGGDYVDDPKARATFGVFKNTNEFIYLREMY